MTDTRRIGLGFGNQEETENYRFPGPARRWGLVRDDSVSTRQIVGCSELFSGRQSFVLSIRFKLLHIHFALLSIGKNLDGFPFPADNFERLLQNVSIARSLQPVAYAKVLADIMPTLSPV